MKLLFLTPYLPYPATKGTSLRNLHIVRWAAREHEVHLLTFAKEDEREAVETLRRELAGVETVPPPRRAAWQRIALLPSPQPDLARRLYSGQFEDRLRQTLHTGDFDLVQIEGLEMGRYGLQVSRGRSGAKPRIVFDDHNAEYALQRSVFRADAGSPARWVGAAYSLLQWPKLRRFERQVCLQADALVAVSNADAASLDALDGRLHPQVVPNGVDTSYFQYCPKERPPYADQPDLVFTGTLDYRPNVDAATWFCDRVLPLVRRHRPGVRMLLVGRDPSPSVKRLAGPAVTVTGAVDDVRDYLYNGDVFVAPLRMGSGTRLKLLEAMSCGLPAVSTSTGIEGLDLTPGQEVLVADDAPAFAAAVLEMLADPDKARSMAERARCLTEQRYDWKAILLRLERVYAESAG